MRIFSNTLLSWPYPLHIFQASRLYPGRWHNYYFYKINIRKPLILNTYSPLELLQENNAYYCYDNFNRNKHLETYGNTLEIVNNLNQKSEFRKQIWVHIPKIAEVNDIIVIHNTKSVVFPSANFKPYFLTIPNIA